MKLYSKYCPICKNKKFTNIFSQNTKPNLNYVACNKCDHIFQNPYNKINDKKFYGTKIYYTAQNIKSKTLIKRFKDIEKEILLFSKKKSIKIFDYGCGNASFLNYLKNRGYKNLTGYEIYCKNYNSKNIKIRNNIKKINKKFDIICLNHVLEHIVNPVKVINFLKSKFLSKQGIIIIEVPDNSIIDTTSFKPGAYVKEHFSQFTLKSIFDLSKKCNLLMFRSKHINCIDEWRDPFIPILIAVLKNDKDIYINNRELASRNKLNMNYLKNKIYKIKNNNISLFGCGDGMDFLLPLIKRSRIKHLIDNNTKIIGKLINGIKIDGPNIISGFSKNDNIIISALSVKNEISIRKQILKINKKVNIINLTR